MKKIFSLMIAMFALCSMAFAQNDVYTNHVVGSQFTDNWFVSLNAGAATPMSNVNINRTRFIWGAEVGKMFTPTYGVSVTGEAGVNTLGTKTAFDNSNVAAHFKVNMMNLVAGYKGEPRLFEVVLSPGIGWEHIYGAPDNVRTNHLSYNVDVDCNFNLGKTKKWQVGVTPFVRWYTGGEPYSLGMNRRRAIGGVKIAVTYKLFNHNGSHNFKKCDKVYTQAQYNVLLDELNTAKAALANAQPVTKEVIKETVVEKVTPVQSTFVVTFEKGKAELTETAKKELDLVTGTVDIVASASPEGAKTFNQSLSEARAANVANYLVKRGIKTNIVKGVGAANDASNRIAIVTVK